MRRLGAMAEAKDVVEECGAAEAEGSDGGTDCDWQDQGLNGLPHGSGAAGTKRRRPKYEA